MPQWRNWSSSVVATPSHHAWPRSEQELADLVTRAGKLRVVGAGHSFMPLCATDDTLISMANYDGALEIAADRKTAWVPAGWGLDRLTDALWAEGLSLINQGDINPQSLAGATATGTHGTGATLGSISTQACGYRLMLADGTVAECSPEQHPDLYQAQRLSLGLFGVATAIRLHIVPAYHLEERICRLPLAEIVDRFDEFAAATRHMEFFVFPYCDDVIFKTLHPAQPEGDFRDGNDSGESIFRTVCDIGAKANALIPPMQRLMMRLSAKPTSRIGPAYKVFPSDRTVRFEEMEYEFPREAGLPTLQDAIAHIRKHRLPIAFPFEFRLAAADDIWMSPFNRAQIGASGGASVSFHQFAKMPWQAHFREIESIFQAGGGRPHWAKRHTLTPADVHRLYPKARDFLAVRAKIDPERKFTNAHLAALFGIAA